MGVRVGCRLVGKLSGKSAFVGNDSSLDQNPVLPAVSLELPTPSKWLKSAWNAWKTRFRQSFFSQIFWGGSQTPPCGLRAFGARGRPAPAAAAPRTSTQSYRESNRFHPVRLWGPTYCRRSVYITNTCFLLDKIYDIKDFFNFHA